MIIVSPLHAAPALVLSNKASHAISLLSPETPWPVFPSLTGDRHLKLALSDISMPVPGLTAPQASDAEKLIAFIRGWDKSDPMLIHCWAGISRSTASAYAAMCMLRDESEDALARELRHVSPSATPNPLLVEHVDRLLGRKGRMIKAIKDIGRGADAFEGVPFQINV